MTGVLIKTETGWQVNYAAADLESGKWIAESLPLHPEEAQICEQHYDNSADWDRKVIKFEKKISPIDFKAYACTIAYDLKEQEEPNEAPAIESVPAPGDPTSELRRVREAKNRHVKERNWEIAALYREIEKRLQESQRSCSNCQYMLSAIGVGQGQICELNRCRIPHSEHSCQYHWFSPVKRNKS